MFDFSGDVLIEDEFLRDGLQNEKRLFSLDEKLRFVGFLEAAGVRRIQVGSFVHPKWVPQMAETDALFERIEPRPGTVYSALVLNGTGLDRALDVGVRHLSISISASETHSRKNTNRSVEEGLARIVPGHPQVDGVRARGPARGDSHVQDLDVVALAHVREAVDRQAEVTRLE